MHIDKNKKSLLIDKYRITFWHESVRHAIELDEIVVVVFEWPKNIPEYWNNVIAIDKKSGEILWEIEPHPNKVFDFKNPSSSCNFENGYLVLHKSNGLKVAVVLRTGKIITSIDLNTGRRPW